MYIIAEMAYSHDGSLDKAKKIADAASKAGANALSIHVTKVSDYIVPHYGSGPGRVSQGKESQKIYDYLSEITISHDRVKDLAQHAQSIGLDLIVMPNDMASFNYAQTLNVTAYVVAPTCMQEIDLIQAIASAQKPIYLRIGGATLTEIGDVIELIQKNGNKSITLLYGHQNYPTAIEDNNLRRLTTFAKTFGLPVGVADHTDADDEFSTILPLLAIPFGITCIEKHITYKRAEKGEDFESALDEHEFALMVKNVKKAVLAMGKDDLIGYSSSSQQYRLNTRKRIVASRNIEIGEKITKDMCILKRSDEGLLPNEIENIVGLVCNKPISKDDGIAYISLKGH
jgi:sialic acid synthase SpsE